MKTLKVFFGIMRRQAVESAPPEKARPGLALLSDMYGG
jgi:hypothetical protein